MVPQHSKGIGTPFASAKAAGLDDVQKVVWGLSGSVAQWIATDSQKIMYFVNQKQTRVLCLIDGVWSKKIHKIKHRKT
jgi:hypothetical protein